MFSEGKYKIHILSSHDLSQVPPQALTDSLNADLDTHTHAHTYMDTHACTHVRAHTHTYTDTLFIDFPNIKLYEKIQNLLIDVVWKRQTFVSISGGYILLLLDRFHFIFQL